MHVEHICICIREYMPWWSAWSSISWPFFLRMWHPFGAIRYPFGATKHANSECTYDTTENYARKCVHAPIEKCSRKRTSPTLFSVCIPECRSPSSNMTSGGCSLGFLVFLRLGFIVCAQILGTCRSACICLCGRICAWIEQTSDGNDLNNNNNDNAIINDKNNDDDGSNIYDNNNYNNDNSNKNNNECDQLKHDNVVWPWVCPLVWPCI